MSRDKFRGGRTYLRNNAFRRSNALAPKGPEIYIQQKEAYDPALDADSKIVALRFRLSPKESEK